jgi:hypothetical protein
MPRLICIGLIAGIALSACGGGGGSSGGVGGGGSGGGGGGGGGATTGQFGVSPSTLTFSAASAGGTSIGPQTITGTISGVSVPTLYLNVQVVGNAVSAVSNVRITGPNTGTADVSPFSQDVVGPGSFTSTITITACSTSIQCTSGIIGSPQTVNVTYNVTGVRSSQSSLAFSAGDNLATGVLSHTFSVTGYPAQSWTAVSSVPWLAVSPSSGNAGSATTVTASLIPAEVDLLASGSFNGAITVTPTSGLPLSIPVTLDVSRVRVNYVAPYVAYTGVSGAVIIRGENLSRYTTTGVRFGSVDASSFTLVSDTEIRATYPALTPGNYDVHLLNAAGVDRTRATLVVVDPGTYVAANLAYPFSSNAFPHCLVYDAERRSLVAQILFNDATMSTNLLLRYSMNSGWTTVANVTLPSDASCALTADGKRILVGRNANGTPGTFTVAEHDPVTLAESKQTLDPLGLSLFARGIAVANTGTAIFVTEYARSGEVKSYSPLNPGIGDFRSANTTPNTYDGQIASSADGSSVLLGSWYGGGLRYITRYDSNTNQLQDTSFLYSLQAIAINRDGSRILLNQAEVYDKNFNLIGTLPGTTRMGALSPTMLRAYTYDASGTIRTFDISSAVAGSFAEVAAPIPVTSDPGSVYGNNMIVTLDGKAIFLAGSARLLLIPLL